jgi:hypothetical protein
VLDSLARGIGSLPDPAHFSLLIPGVIVMDLAQILIFDLGWIFFAAWGVVLAAVTAIAFGADLFPSSLRTGREPEQR